MKLVVILIFLFLVPVSRSAQTPAGPPHEVRVVFNSLHSSLESLQRRFEKQPANIAESLVTIEDYVKFLEAELTSDKPLPRVFLEGVASNARALEQLAKQPAKTRAQQKRLYDGLKAVESDLEVKISGPRNGGDVARSVRVTVRAKKANLDVAAYEVWYVRRFWATKSKEYRRFDGLTDPANPPSMPLSPGNYLIWLSKDQIETPRLPVTIGKYSEDKRDIAVPVP
jgi:hypothetical protein